MNSVTARGRKRTAEESILSEDDSSLNVDNSFTDTIDATATTDTNATNSNDASAVILYEDEDDGTMIQDALEAWEEMGDLSKQIAQSVLTNTLKRLHKCRRLSNGILNNNKNNTNGDTKQAVAFFNMIQRAKHLQQCVLLFCHHHEVLRQELEDLLEQSCSTDHAAVSSAGAPCE